MDRRNSLHAVTWLVWALAAVASVQLAPSPVYVALVIGLSALVVEVHAPADSPLARAFPVIVGLGVAFGLVRIALNLLTTHGVGDVMFTLPDATLPRLLGGFTVGGSVELQVLAQSAAEALVIVGIMAAFGAFNAVVSHYELLQSAPRAFYEPGLVVTVALAFVPSTVAAVHAVREADRARTGGRVVRRGRLLRTIVPLLESGMERAVSLAESMDSRGFAHLPPSRADRFAGWVGLGSLLCLGGGFVALVGRERTAAGVLGAVGTAALVAAIVLASRGTRRTRYRPRRLGRRDVVVMAAAFTAPVALALLAAAGDDSLTWSATTPLHAPSFRPLVALSLIGLALPALRGPARVTAAPRRVEQPEPA